MAQEEILRLCAAGVTRARELCEDVEFSPEDASRTELEFLARLIEVAIARRGHHGEYPRYGRLHGAG